MNSAEIREAYLKFFEEKGCKRMPSSSLIPDDPSMLLTSAGMVQFKPYFLHQKELEGPYIGATTCQKCLRTSDIENIGITGRHLSFFEMLGNFSFGKYFKKEMCAWALEFSLDVLKFPMEKLYFSIYEKDEETAEIWKNLGVPEDRIVRLGEDDNFWLAGETGPCGPCSEIYYDQGPEFGCGKPDCAPGCDCDRYIEYWNCVFTQYDRQEDGTFKELPSKNIDTGMGLERVAALSQGKPTNYESDILWSLIELVESLTGRKYGENKRDDMGMRIIADHSRAVTFMLADGILPSNEGRGYVLRRLLRRAVRYGHLMGIKDSFLNKFVDEVARLMGHAYPEVMENLSLVKSVVAAEEDRFRQTLVRGEDYLNDAISKIDGKVLSGEVAFTLHDTYGFPIELTTEICNEQGISVDEDKFKELMEEQRERARSHVKEDAWGMYGGVYADIAKTIPATTFVGYENNEAEGKVLAIVQNGESVASVSAPANDVEIFLDTTPFYGEMGGQVGDTGTLEADGFKAEVTDATFPEKGFTSHKANVTEGTVKVGDTVTAKIDVLRRERIRRNHTATHILQYALQQVLGDHTKQAGSLVAPNRLRFDFTHFEGMTKEQISEVEKIVNDKIMENHKVTYHVSTLDEARASGAMALFGEKYGEVVRVVEAGDFSKELCGGTHVSMTSEIGLFKIVSESSVGSNTRRIEALTSFDAFEYLNEQSKMLEQLGADLKVAPNKVAERVAADEAKIKGFEKAAKKAQKKSGDAKLESSLKSETKIEAKCPVTYVEFEGIGMNDLKTYWDGVKAKAEGPVAVVCSSVADGKVSLLAAANDEAVEAGFDANAVIKEISPLVGGRGGGKPKMAQAGGKDAAGVAKIADILNGMF